MRPSSSPAQHRWWEQPCAPPSLLTRKSGARLGECAEGASSQITRTPDSSLGSVRATHPRGPRASQRLAAAETHPLAYMNYPRDQPGPCTQDAGRVRMDLSATSQARQRCWSRCSSEAHRPINVQGGLPDETSLLRIAVTLLPGMDQGPGGALTGAQGYRRSWAKTHVCPTMVRADWIQGEYSPYTEGNMPGNG
jgi:hypothetical protein